MRSQKELLRRVVGEKRFLVVVLDACRPDSLERWLSQNRPGLLKNLSTVRSPGRTTKEWFHGAFGGRFFGLTYVSATPFINSAGITSVGRVAVASFEKIVDAWKAWDGKEDTCPPWEVNRITARHLGDPRLIVHYLQPHQPYIGEVRIPREWYYREVWVETRGGPAIRQVRPRRFTPEQRALVRRAYESNVDLVCGYAFNLVDRVQRTAVVTADHGEMMGEGGWFHNCGHPDLHLVPWLEIRG